MKKNSKKIDYLDFFKTVGKSKNLLRSGWKREKIKDPESIAEHSFRVGVLAMVLSEKVGVGLDKDKLIKMSLLHDLGELVTGDVVAERAGLVDIKKRDAKERREKEGIREIFDKIGGGDEYAGIFEEMIQRVTPESKVFWQFDKLEMALQAYEYEKTQGKNLEEFFTSASLHIKEPFLKEIFGDVLNQRRKKRKN
ncbi:MAG: hypothetical protein ACD_50C00082G0002 [uncultured bacterium]|nr:MAG: hypothetical protein ACD_50C00082G0002 [uncultured bacterium]OGH13190.1 MAG: hypothetical protein A2687_00625 [Candidatus Levybacteria bacterium RIFCSPHIGHO2_01_FULL_38_26]